MGSLQGKIVVITGASSGIGRLAARRFAEKGATVVLAARTEASLRDAVAECEAAGGRAVAVPTDVADHGAIDQLAARTLAAFGRIDVWVNNAAVMAYGEVEQIPPAVHRRVIEVSLLGQLYGTAAAVRQMKRQGEGVIVNVASLYSKMTSPYVASYVVSKFGVLALSEVVGQELARYPKIEVATVLPGSTDTPIFRHAANYTGRKPRPVPPVADADRAARAIMRAATRPKREITVGVSQRVLSWAHVLVPGLYGRLAPYAMRWGGMTGEPAENAPGNVFEPKPELNEPESQWRNRWLRIGAVGIAAATGAGAAVAARWRR